MKYFQNFVFYNGLASHVVFNPQKWRWLTLAKLCLLFIAFMPSWLIGQVHDFTEAKELASKQEKNILMVFSGSDWCKPCIKLKKEILDTPQFAKFESDHVVILELDFPYKKENELSKNQKQHNESLADVYNKKGAFPKVILMDSKGEIISEIGYSKGMSPQVFIEKINKSI